LVSILFWQFFVILLLNCWVHAVVRNSPFEPRRNSLDSNGVHGWIEATIFSESPRSSGSLEFTIFSDSGKRNSLKGRRRRFDLVIFGERHFQSFTNQLCSVDKPSGSQPWFVLDMWSLCTAQEAAQNSNHWTPSQDHFPNVQRTPACLFHYYFHWHSYCDFHCHSH
jgi:hypothetical protein